MTAPATWHAPVLLEPILALAAGARRAVDATLGDGGHSAGLRALGLTVLGIDRDPVALERARARLGDDQLEFLLAPYASDAALDAVRRFQPDVLLLDLGVSSRQLDDDALGFSFRPGAPLDMRMSRSGPSAATLLAEAPEQTLGDWFRDYGDERKWRGLAREVVRRRARQAFTSSDDLVNAIRAVLGPTAGPGDFARIFQAVRIAVNDELAGLAHALPAFRDALTPGGRLLVITYHSGEDRLVKHTFREWATGCICPPGLPACACGRLPLGALDPKDLVPGADEVAANPRARSARLRGFRRAA